MFKTQFESGTIVVVPLVQFQAEAFGTDSSDNTSASSIPVIYQWYHHSKYCGVVLLSTY